MLSISGTHGNEKHFSFYCRHRAYSQTAHDPMFTCIHSPSVRGMSQCRSVEKRHGISSASRTQDIHYSR